MGFVYRKKGTRPLPTGAEIFVRNGERFARWKNRRGRAITAPLTTGTNGIERIVTKSPFYIAKFRDGAGRVREVATRCKDETAARQVLADLERRGELVRSGVITSREDAIADHQAVPLQKHFDAFEKHLQAKGVTPVHKANTRRWLNRVASEAEFLLLTDSFRGLDDERVRPGRRLARGSGRQFFAELRSFGEKQRVGEIEIMRRRKTCSNPQA